MASFKDKIKGKKVIGKRAVNSDEAIQLAFKDSKKKLFEVKLSALQTNPNQPRLTMEQEELENLAQSIEQNGLLQPILVTPINNNPHKFYIVAGHRRVEASKLLQRESIEAMIYSVEDENLSIFAIIENLQRENLSAMEEAISIKSLVDMGLTQTQICQKISKSKSVVSNLLKLTTLHSDVVAFIKENNINFGATILYELTKLDEKEQLHAIEYIYKHQMKREDIRLYIKSLLNKDKEQPTKPKSFSFSNKKNRVSFKLDLEKISKEEKHSAIKALEDLLKKLKS